MDEVFVDDKPIYRQIAERLERDVLTGELQAHDQVMSTNEYASFYRINPATAGKAFQELVDRGVLYKKRGIGMFVTAEASELLQKEHRKRFVDAVLVPLIAEARAIGLGVEEVVEAIRQVAKEEEWT